MTAMSARPAMSTVAAHVATASRHVAQMTSLILPPRHPAPGTPERPGTRRGRTLFNFAEGHNRAITELSSPAGGLAEGSRVSLSMVLNDSRRRPRP